MPDKVTHDDLTQNFHLLRSDPAKFLELADELVRQNPKDHRAYFRRHWPLALLGQHDLALADLDQAISLEEHYGHREARGDLLRDMGRLPEAIDEYDRAESMDPEAWLGGFGPLFRADCHARLGNLEAALADCATLRDEHWTPGMNGTPAGNKEEVAAELRRRATAARKS